MKKSWVIFELFCVILFASFIVLYFGRFGFVFYDFSFFLDIAWRLMNGQHLYRDIGNVTSGPLIYILQAIFFKLFGVRAFSALIHAATFNALTSGIIFLYFSRQLPRPWPLVFAFITAIFFYGVLGWPWMERPSYFFLLLSFLLWDFLGQEGSRRISWCLFAIGFLTSLSFWDKQSIASVLTVLNFILSIFWVRYRRESWSHLGTLFLGFLFPMVFFFIFLHFTGSLEAFYQEYFFRALGFRRLHGYFTKLQQQIIFWPFFLDLLVSLVALKIVVKESKGQRTWRATLVLAAVLFQVVNAPLTSAPYLWGVPLSGLILGWCFSLCLVPLFRYSIGVGVVSFLFLSVGFYSTVVRGSWQFVLRNTPLRPMKHPFFAGFQIQQPFGEELDLLLDWLKSHLKEDETFWIFPNQVVAYAAVQKVSKAPLVTFEIKTLTPFDDAKLVAWLHRLPPKFFVFERRNTQSTYAHNPLLILSTLPQVKGFIETHYLQEEHTSGYEIYRLRPVISLREKEEKPSHF